MFKIGRNTNFESINVFIAGKISFNRNRSENSENLKFYHELLKTFNFLKMTAKYNNH